MFDPPTLIIKVKAKVKVENYNFLLKPE